MSLEIVGKLIEKFDTQVISDRFKKREFVLETIEGPDGSSWTNYAKMQLVQAKTDVIDRFNIGDNLRVSFNVKGNKYEKDGKVNYITNLDAWRVEMADAGGGQQQPQGGYGAPQQQGYGQQPGGNAPQNQGNAGQGAYSQNNAGFNNPNTAPSGNEEGDDGLPF